MHKKELYILFDEKNSKKSRFGTKSNNSRMSIWKSGKFLSGQFHSYLNLDDNGNTQVSEIHKYSKWLTGFCSGDFWGGLAYNINFKNGIWHGGILQDIEISHIDSPNSAITLKGEWEFTFVETQVLEEEEAEVEEDSNEELEVPAKA